MNDIDALSALLIRADEIAERERPQYVDDTHPKQRAFVVDGAKRIVALCGRRGGKTDGISRRLVTACQKGGLAIYFALSRPYAKRLMWEPLKALNRKYNLGLVPKEADLQLYHPKTGGQIWLLGVNSVDEREKARGHAIMEADLDEAGSYGGYLDYLLEEVLDPAMQDYDGTVCMTGTPPRVAAGYFYDVSVGNVPGWSRHSFNVFDNSLFPRWSGDPEWQEKSRRWFEGYLAERKWTRDDPRVRREWFAEWIHDSDALVYKFDLSRNCWSERPSTDGWTTIMGIDLGWEDHTAICVVAYSHEDDRLVELETIKQNHLIASEIAEIIQHTVSRYNPRVIRADTGGLGKMLVEEYKKRYKIPILAAEKNSKYDFIEHLNSDLRNGKIQINPDSPLASEWSVLQWDENKHREDPRFPNHAADAFLYAWREAQHFRGKTPDVLPKVGTVEYYRREEKRLEKKALEKARAKPENPEEALL